MPPIGKTGREEQTPAPHEPWSFGREVAGPDALSDGGACCYGGGKWGPAVATVGTGLLWEV